MLLEEDKDKYGNTTYHKGGIIYSINPPEAYMNTSYWNFMMPPLIPKKVLILGVGMNTVGKLLKNHFPNVEQTLVDYDPAENNGAPKDVIKMDARDFVKQAPNDAFDFTVIDCWNWGGAAQWLIDNEEFWINLERISISAAANLRSDRWWMYKHPAKYFRIMHTNFHGQNMVPILMRLRK